MISCCFRAVLLGLLLLQPVVGWGQETQTADDVVNPTWVAPEIISLPVNWWSDFVVEDVEVFRSRADLLTAKINEYVSGLDADNLVTAQSGLRTLKNNLDAVTALQNSSAITTTDALPTYDSYSLEQLFDLRKLRRDGEKQLDILNLEQQQLGQQSTLLSQKRDLNFAQYSKSDPNSPERILTGLTRLNVHLELYAITKQLELNTAQQALQKSHLESINQKIKYATNHLSVDELSLATLDSRIQSISDEATKTTRKLAAVQQKLLDASNTDDPDTYNILNLKQQLTLVSAEELLAQLKLELAFNIRDWYMLRSDAIATTKSLHKRDPLFSAILKGAPQQSALWADASQNTLITNAPENDRAAKKAYDQAQANAHLTLAKIAEIDTTIDNLTLAQSQVASDSLAFEQGLSGARLRIRLFLLDVMEQSKNLVNISLFDLGERPVTIGSILKAILVFIVFLTISWLIRKFLDRLERQKHFQQGSFYAGGRVLHYVILTIAIIVALGTVGLDFSSFTLVAGALSVGIGFGLQSVVLNFVSGLILLFEGSIKVGDYVQLDSSEAGPGLMGVVKEIRSRATLINTNDNVDVIVPNSELVGSRMINWTLKESTARMRIPFSVAYGSDKELVQKAALEAAAEGEFCIHDTPGRHPAVRMMGFGDSALNFELRVWVNRQGVRRPIFVSSSILWAMDDKFREYGVQVPFPQRDVHLTAESGLFEMDLNDD